MMNIWWCEVHLLGGVADTDKADHCPIRWGNYPEPSPCRMVEAFLTTVGETP